MRSHYVGARSYCAKSLCGILFRLGFCNTAVKKCSKSLGLLSTQCSFFIWLHRNNKQWPKPDLIVSSTSEKKVNEPSASSIKTSSGNTVVASIPSSKTENRLVFSHRAGIKNLGNSSFVSSLLQVFSVLPMLFVKSAFPVS